MRTLTLIIAALWGYYYEPCPVCGRGIGVRGDGRFFSVWCSRKLHAAEGTEG